MTPTEYRQAIQALGLSQVRAAKALGVNERTSRRWAKDGAPVRVAWKLSEMLAMRAVDKSLGDMGFVRAL